MDYRTSAGWLVGALLALTIGSSTAGDKHAHAAHWSYLGKQGPAQWSHLDPGYEACSLGQAQSPVDIGATVKRELPPLHFHYGSITPSLVNNGHTVQVNVPAGSSLEVGGRELQLLQFHFHTPSEEAIDGRHADMVAHFVHKDADGKLGVVAVLLTEGQRNGAWAPLFDHLPVHEGEQVVLDGTTLDLGSLLPSTLGYYALQGSLTTPPCSEGVSWMILKQPASLDGDQIDSFRSLFMANARPVQPLHGRVVLESL